MRRRTNPATPRIVACCGGMVRVFGLERMTFELLRALRNRGAAVHCIVNSWESHRIRALAEEIGATTSKGLYYYSFQGLGRNPVRYAQLLWDVLKTSLALIRDGTRFRATHVLVPEFGSVLRNAPALLYFRLRGIPTILRLGGPPADTPKYRRLWRWAVSPLVRVLICNSRFTQEELLKTGVPARKVGQIYNTVPQRQGEPAAAPSKDPRRIVYVGQLIPDKGVHLLLDAVALLVAQGLDPRLDVVGHMSGWEHPAYRGYWDELRARAAQPDLDGRVRFLGQREDVPDLLRASGVHCCPSTPAIREGLGVVNLEAKQASVPSVVTRSGGVPELFEHQVDGWICDQASPQALAEGLGYFLSDPERLERASRAAYESSLGFGAERFARRWWAVFVRGIDGLRSPRD